MSRYLNNKVLPIAVSEISGRPLYIFKKESRTQRPNEGEWSGPNTVPWSRTSFANENMLKNTYKKILFYPIHRLWDDILLQ